MNTDPAVQAALEHAKDVLAEEKAAGDRYEHEWRLQLRHALQDLTAAVQAARGDQ